MAVDRKKTFNDEDVAARLAAELPKWRLEGGEIRRIYHTHGWKSTLMAVNAIGHLAEAAWHHPDLAVSYSKVEVRLSSHDVKGITERDFALARKIEDVVLWQPGSEAGAALEGTPSDPRFAHMKHD
ncbi:4a-hydroxytetrahydrobiopterin dehydratase [Aquabacter sp. CN5-332]|uniref:4a-hydroxytetrahydrobiopterin dehydratase n=1 Tax=Aquabacter sp. CN5-332 TaxID=3156608 RepID=UPI0032B4B3EC